VIHFALDSLVTLGKCLAGIAIVAAAGAVCVAVAGVARGFRDAYRNRR
jgi:hypothetical protein